MDMSIEINDVIDVIKNGRLVISPYLNIVEKPYLKIVVQPEEFIRYRYESEGSSAGIIKGITSTSEIKTFPTVQIVGYKGPVIVILSCGTKDEPYRAHPHNLILKKKDRQGVCKVRIQNEEMIHSFDHLGIKCVKRRDIEKSLRVREFLRVDPFKKGFTHMQKPDSIDLNAIRLCFQAYIEQDGEMKELEPVVSNIIYDEKSLCNLNIHQLSHATAPVTGGLDMILLCEKVNEEVSVRMYEEENDQVVWEEMVKPTRVHKHVAIIFKTPRYRNIEVDKTVNVYIQLQQSAPVKAGSPMPFMLTPLQPVAKACLHHYPLCQSMLFPITQKMDYNPVGSNSQYTPKMDCNSVGSNSQYTQKMDYNPVGLKSQYTPKMDYNPVGLNFQDTAYPSTSCTANFTSLGKPTHLVEQTIASSTSPHITNTVPGDSLPPYSMYYEMIHPSTSKSKLDYNQEGFSASNRLAASVHVLELQNQNLVQGTAGSVSPHLTNAFPGTSAAVLHGNEMVHYNDLSGRTNDDTSTSTMNDIAEITTYSIENVSMHSLSKYLISCPDENLPENLSSLSISL